MILNNFIFKIVRVIYTIKKMTTVNIDDTLSGIFKNLNERRDDWEYNPLVLESVKPKVKKINTIEMENKMKKMQYELKVITDKKNFKKGITVKEENLITADIGKKVDIFAEDDNEEVFHNKNSEMVKIEWRKLSDDEKKELIEEFIEIRFSKLNYRDELIKKLNVLVDEGKFSSAKDIGFDKVNGKVISIPVIKHNTDNDLYYIDTKPKVPVSKKSRVSKIMKKY